jgi:putative signal transducing protein
MEPLEFLPLPAMRGGQVVLRRTHLAARVIRIRGGPPAMMLVAPCGAGAEELIMDGATVPVASVTSSTEAELIVGLLRSNGVTAAVSADDAGGEEPALQLQGVRVLVAPADEALARRILAEVGNSPS